MNPDRSFEDQLALQRAYDLKRARRVAADMCREAKWSPHICDEIEEGKHDGYSIVGACLIIVQQTAKIEELEEQIDGWGIDARERDSLD